MIIGKCMQDCGRAIALGSHYFGEWSGFRHNNRTGDVMLGGGNCDSLSMIACRGCDHTTSVFLLAQAGELETGSTYFEGAGALHVFCFQIDICAGDIMQVPPWREWRMIQARLGKFIHLPHISNCNRV